MKVYRYIGSSKILSALPEHSMRVQVRLPLDVLEWIKNTHQTLQEHGTITATFIVDATGTLWINDQRSEHVLCAAGQSVLSAGEMTFEIRNNTVTVCEVSNQSTGYCPEPESFPAVHAALNAATIAHPMFFTTAFVFRRCEGCETINIVKDEWFECAVCGTTLPAEWNVDPLP